MRNALIGKTALYASALLLAATLFGGTAGAAWIRGQVHLNLRTGPGTERRIITTISTGDRVTVLDSTEEWIQVRIADGREGWIPIGFLADEAPANIRLERSEAELSELRENLEETTTEAEELRSSNATLTTRSKELSEENKRLTTENHRLKGGARWSEWITGASILVVGMLIGAILQSWSSRRSHSRVRL
jgi:SH3 domain protein